jgi:hypothetical protein
MDIIFGDGVRMDFHRFKPLWIGLSHFVMFNVFLDSPISIGISLHIIPS